MRINTNVSALNSLSSLNKVQDNVASSMQKLSSGFRINKAGDDAAGLGISNQMGADIKAMTQASRNAEQAGSVLQIMDGATSNVQTILERMKELAAQSASDTVDNPARTKIDSEFGTLTSELDRIVSTTKFLGASLLNGSFGSKAVTSGSVKTAASTLIGGDVSNVTVSNAGAYGNFGTINAAVSVTGQTAPAAVTGSADTVTVNSQTLVNTLSSGSLTLGSINSGTTIGAASSGTSITIGAAATVTSVTAGSAVTAGDYSLAVVNGSDATHTNFTLTGPGGYTSAITGVVDGAASVAFTGGITVNLHGGKVQADYTALDTQKLQVRQAYDLTLVGGGLGLQTASIVDNGTTTGAAFTNYGLTVNVATNTATALAAKTIDLTETLQMTLSGTNSSTGAVQTQSVAINANPASQTLSFTGTFGVQVVLGAGATDISLKAQVNSGGKNQIVQNGTLSAQFLVSSSQSYTGNDLISLAAVDLTSTTLGVTRGAVNLTTAAGAQAALTTIDTAIGAVGTALGAIGAAENRVTYANTNVKTSIQNFTAAQSAIKDVDMAQEMTNFSKNQILSQASTAMLAQANQLGQSVLKLLQ